MGCGRSKFESDREAEAKGKIPPLIRRRIEEIKRKRHEAAVKNTLSKKKLLKAEGTEEEDNSESSGSKESMRKAMVAPEPQTVCCDLKKDEKMVEAIAPTMEEIEEEKEKENEEEEEDDEDEDEGRLSSVNDAMIFPGSPSFRVYCIDQTTETSNDEVCKDDVSSEKLKACDSSEMDSVISTEDSPDKPEKRKKGKRFRILPKGSRNFLGCYNGDRNKHQLLTHKVAA